MTKKDYELIAEGIGALIKETCTHNPRFDFIKFLYHIADYIYDSGELNYRIIIKRMDMK
jgi:hypothetical protein